MSGSKALTQHRPVVANSVDYSSLCTKIAVHVPIIYKCARVYQCISMYSQLISNSLSMNPFYILVPPKTCFMDSLNMGATAFRLCWVLF